MKKSRILWFVIGIILGGVIFGGTIAYGAGIMAQPKTAAVVIDGQAVDLKGYVIEGNHYFQLRDLDEKLISGGKDFSVVWDGQGNQVIIDTGRGYDPNEQYENIAPPVTEIIQDTPPVGAAESPTDAAKPTESTEEAPVMTIDEMKEEIIRLTNIERVKAGVPELEPLPALMDCAQAKADDMRDNGYFSHTSPTYGRPGEMIRSFVPSAKSSGENLKALIGRFDNVRDPFAGWIESSGHHKTMLNPAYTHIGIGIVNLENGNQIWVQQFATQ